MLSWLATGKTLLACDNFFKSIVRKIKIYFACQALDSALAKPNSKTFLVKQIANVCQTIFDRLVLENLYL